MDYSRFLITGLPRCRTAWLTVLYMTLGIDVRHERWMFTTLRELDHWLNTGTPHNQVGLIDGLVPIYYPEYAIDKFTNNPVVLIDRPVDDVYKSWLKFRPTMTRNEFDESIANYDQFRSKLNALVVPFCSLNSYETCYDITLYTSQTTISYNQWRILDKMQIELQQAKIAEIFVTRSDRSLLNLENDNKISGV